MKRTVMDGDAPFLPEEIITNILKRLPVKSLIRFQCVCKRWKNLFKTASFIADHFHHSSVKNPLLLLQWDDKCDPLHLHMLDHELEIVEVQPSPLIDSLTMARIIGSSYGLLCVNVGIYVYIPNFLLWNPATGQVGQVPPCGLDDFSFVGFGFSPIVNDYKIVISRKLKIDYKYYGMEVYSLSTGSWKEIKVENFGVVCVSDNSFSANGAIFWSGKYKGHDKYNDVIVSFDIAMEVFTLIPMPAFGSDSYHRHWHTVYENKLTVISITVSHESYLIDLWVMEEGRGAFGERWSWTKKHTIRPSSRLLSPCGIWLDEIVCNIEVIPKGRFYKTESDGNNRVVTVLSLLNLTTHKLENFATRRCGVCFSVSFNYAESLAPIGNIQIEEP